MTYRAEKRNVGGNCVELLLDVFFEDSDNNSPVRHLSASVCICKEKELLEMADKEWPGELCIEFFHNAIRCHYYGFSGMGYRRCNPVYMDCERTTEGFHNCFTGFLLKHSHASYMPRGKKVWYD